MLVLHPLLLIAFHLTNLCSYLRNGVQINSPNDTHIVRHINSNLEPWKTAWEPLQTHIDYLNAHELHSETKRFDYYAYDTVFNHWATRIREYTVWLYLY